MRVNFPRTFLYTLKRVSNTMLKTGFQFAWPEIKTDYNFHYLLKKLLWLTWILWRGKFISRNDLHGWRRVTGPHRKFIPAYEHVTPFYNKNIASLYIQPWYTDDVCIHVTAGINLSVFYAKNSFFLSSLILKLTEVCLPYLQRTANNTCLKH